MRVPEATRARIDHLRRATLFFCETAPATSSVLGTELDTVLGKISDVSGVQLSKICGCCGSILVPGKTCTVSLGKQTSKSNLKRNPGRQEGRSRPPIVHKCKRCESETIISNPGPLKKVSHKGPAQSIPSQLASKDLPPALASKSKGPPSANAVSKKRVKARKLGNLQAMVDRSKLQNHGRAEEFNMSLMDLLKSD